MKISLFLIASLFVVSTSPSRAQLLLDYVLAQRGDTLVVKDYADMGNKVNALGWVFATTTAPNLKLVFDNCLMERTRWVFVSAQTQNVKRHSGTVTS